MESKARRNYLWNLKSAATKTTGFSAGSPADPFLNDIGFRSLGLRVSCLRVVKYVKFLLVGIAANLSSICS